MGFRWSHGLRVATRCRSAREGVRQFAGPGFGLGLVAIQNGFAPRAPSRHPTGKSARCCSQPAKPNAPRHGCAGLAPSRLRPAVRTSANSLACSESAAANARGLAQPLPAPARRQPPRWAAPPSCAPPNTASRLRTDCSGRSQPQRAGCPGGRLDQIINANGAVNNGKLGVERRCTKCHARIVRRRARHAVGALDRVAVALARGTPWPSSLIKPM